MKNTLLQFAGAALLLSASTVLSAAPVGAEPLFSNRCYSADCAGGIFSLRFADGAPALSVSGFEFIPDANGAPARAAVSGFRKEGGDRFILPCETASGLLPSNAVVKITGEFKERFVVLRPTVVLQKGTGLSDRRIRFSFAYASGGGASKLPHYVEKWNWDEKRDRLHGEWMGDLFAVDGLASPLWIRRKNGGWTANDVDSHHSVFSEWCGSYSSEFILLLDPASADPASAAATSHDSWLLAIDSGAPLDVFDRSPASFKVTAGNNLSTKPIDALLSVVVTDYDGRVVLSNAVRRADLAPGAVFTETFAPPAKPGREVYTVWARLRAGGRWTEAKARLVQCPMPKLSNPAKLGVALHYPHPDPAKEEAMERLLGAAGVRFFDGEPGRGFETIGYIRVPVKTRVENQIEAVPTLVEFRKQAERVVRDCGRRGAKTLYVLTDISVPFSTPNNLRKEVAASLADEFLARAKILDELRRRHARSLALSLVCDGENFAHVAKAADGLFQSAGSRRIRPKHSLASFISWQKFLAESSGFPYVLQSFEAEPCASADTASKKRFPPECTVLPHLCAARFHAPGGAMLHCAQNGNPIRHGVDVVDPWNERWWADSSGLFEAPTRGGGATPSLCAFATAAEYLDGASGPATVSRYQDKWSALSWNSPAHGRVDLVLLHDIYETLEATVSDLRHAENRKPENDRERTFVFPAAKPVVTVVDAIGRKTEHRAMDGKVAITLDERPALILGIDLGRFDPDAQPGAAPAAK